MKRVINITLLALLSFGLHAQTEYDALRLSQTDIQGTARYMSLAGAMGALGADASAIKDNPAGLAIYRGSELTATLDFTSNNISPIEWHNRSRAQERYINSSFTNVSYVVNMPANGANGLINSNFSFSFQKLADYNKRFNLSGGNTTTSFTDYIANFSSPNPPLPGDISYDNLRMPWLTVLGYDGYLINPDGDYFTSLLSPGERVSPSYDFLQTGSLSEVNFGWGGNYNNNFFLGASLNLRLLEYGLSTVLSEDFEGGGGFDLKNRLSQNGVGVNAKFGMIYLLENGLRLGLAFHTPTVTMIEEESYADLYSSEIPDDEKYPAETPINAQSFNLWSPMQLQASAAYIIGGAGFISAEYDLINYSLSHFQQNRNSVQSFGDINAAMRDVLNSVHMLKLGAEARLTDNIALRAGYALVSPATNQNYNNGKLLVQNTVNTNTEYFDQKFSTNLYTMGLGYRTNSWYFDFAYSYKMQTEEFYPYQDRALLPAKIDNSRSNYTFTVGLRM